jgi:hypothetical protein
MAKTDAEVANINARSGISTARSLSTINKHLQPALGQLEQGTLERALNRAYEVGFTAGAKDAMG